MNAAATRPDRSWVGVAACWLGYGAIGVSSDILGPILPALRVHLHAGYGELAFLFAAGSVGSTLATVFGNRLLDRVGYRRLLVLCGAVLALACVARADVSSLGAWMAASLVAGFAASGIDIGGIRYVTATAAESRRNAALNLLNVFYSAGAVAAPLVVSALAAAGASVLWAYVFAAACLALMAVTAQVAVPSVRPPVAEGRMVGAWRWVLGQPVLVRLAAMIALYAAVETGFASWVASYAHSRAHLTVAAAALFPLIFWAAMTAGRSVAAERARHWSEGRLVALGTATAITGGALTLLFRAPLGIAGGAALSGLGCAPIWPSVFALAARAAPERHSEAYGLLFPAGSAGVLVAPWLAGELFSAGGPRAALAVPLVSALLLGALSTYVLRRDLRGAIAAD